ncbi:MAG TPA: AAA family ATPase, partial [Candidatus Kapabacteria bacterium]|nr:AAA family ATPase [Candidatus Kapabacteria bacterium]
SDFYLPIHQDAGFFRINNQVVFRQLFFEHKDIHNDKVGFFIEEESDGTRRIIDLLPIVLTKNIKDRVWIIDEIDNSLHPNLCYEFVKSLMTDRNGNSQIIFTTHQPNLLTRELFRDDEIWFVEKDKHKGNTSLYPLFEFDVKEGFNIQDGYLLGRFGGVPILDTHNFML